MDQSKVKMSITQRGNNFDSKRGEKEEVAKMGRKQRGLMDLGGGQVKCLMMVSIQASVSGSICQFLQIYGCFDYVVINHQKRRDCKEHGPN